MNARLIASTLGLLLSLAGCASDRVTPSPESAQPAEPVKPPEIKIGLLLPLSGPAEVIGRDMLDAAQMALFDVGDNKLVLLPRDTAGTPAGARLAAQEVIREGAEVILGPLLAADVAAVSPIAAQANIRVLAFSNDASVATDGTFLLGFRPEEQVRRVVAYALDSGALVRAAPAPLELGAAAPDVQGQGLPNPDQPAPNQTTPERPSFDARPPRIAGLAPDDAYGATVLEALRRAVVEGGGELAETLVYPPNMGDPSAVVRRIAGYDQRSAALEAERARLGRERRPPGAADAAGPRDARLDWRPAVRCDPAGRRRRQPALDRGAAHLFRRRPGDDALSRYDALAGRPAGAGRGCTARRLVRGAAAGRPARVREPFPLGVRAQPGAARRARLRCHGARGGGRARSGRSQLLLRLR